MNSIRGATPTSPCDYVLFCVKTFDTDVAAARLGPLIGEGTAVVSLQNGIENEDRGGAAADRGHPRRARRRAAFSRLVAEVCAVAEADGTPVPQAAQERALALAQAAEPGSFSLHDDLVAGRRMELEALHGFVVRRAAQHGLAVPASETMYAILQPWAIRNQRAERPIFGTSASESPAM
jgi:ketopantoate reductase